MNEPTSVDEVFEAWRARADAGEAVDPDSVVRSHPDIADELRARFEALQLLDGVFAHARGSRPPARVGEYRIVRELGRGGMGIVYEAMQESMRRPVALKVLYPSIAPTAGAVRRFQQEARIAGRLKHTNIVAVHALGQDAGLWWCAMELVDGPPLSQVVERVRSHAKRAGAAPPSGPPSTLTGEPAGGANHFVRVARMFAEVADALHVAHEAGVVHRDLKPSNLLLDRDGHLRLVDFGLARLEGSAAHLTRTGDVVGTPLYMSPEQYRGDASEVGPSTDVYSLGVTLYEALTLRPPHEGGDPARLAARILTEDPPRPRSIDRRVPSDLDTIVMKCLERDAARRYGSASALAEDLRAFASGDAIRARRAGPLARAWKRVRRRPARSIAAAALVLGISASALFATHASREGDARRDAEYRMLLARAVESRPAADALYEQAIALDASRSDAWVARALSGGPPLEARLRDVEESEARGVGPTTAALLRSYLHSALGRVDEGEAWRARAGAAADSDDPLARLVSAFIASRSGDLARAERDYTECLARAPRGSVLRRLALNGRGEAYLWTSQHAKALDDFLGLRALGDDRIRSLAVEAWLWRRLGKEAEATARADALMERAATGSGEAIEVCECFEEMRCQDWLDRATASATERFPQKAALWGLRASALDSLWRWDEALAQWDRAIAINPGVGWLVARRAQTLANMGRGLEALEASALAVSLSPDDAETLIARADVCRRVERYVEGRAAAEAALRIDPRNASAVRLAAACAMAVGDLDVAERRLVEARRLKPDNPEIAATTATLRIRQGRFPEAVADLERALQVDPRRPDWWFLRGQALKAAKDFAGAEVSLRKALDLRPGYVDAWKALGYVCAMHERWDGSLEAWRKVLEFEPNCADAWLGVGTGLKNTNDPQGALDAYEKASALDPSETMTVGNAAGVLVDLGRLEEAMKKYDLLIESEPDDAAWRFNRGIALQKLGKGEEALVDFRETARLEPENPFCHIRAAEVLCAAGRLDDALAEAEIAARLAPGDASIQRNLAAALFRTKRLDRAEETVRKAIALDDRDHLAWLLLSGILERKEDPQRAVEAAEKARSLAPDKFITYHACASCYFTLKRDGSAADVLAQAVRRFPDNATAHFLYAWVLTMSADLAVREPGAAAEHARKATELDPATGSYWMALGAALVRQGRHGEAVVRLEHARTVDGKDVEPSASFFLAMALHRSGRVDDARAAFDRAAAVLRADPSDDEPSQRLQDEASKVLSGK